MILVSAMAIEVLRSGGFVSRPIGSCAAVRVIVKTKIFAKLYLLILLGLVFGTAATAAEAEGWAVLHSQGAVLVLNGDQWSDLPAGEAVPEGVPIRTLKGATVTLSHAGHVVMLAPDSAARLDAATRTSTVMTQFAGKLTVEVRGARGRQLLIRTPSLTIDVQPGSARLEILAEAGKVEVIAGTAIVIDPKTSVQTTVAAGEVVLLTDMEAAAAALLSQGVTGTRMPLDHIETGAVAKSLGTVAKSVQPGVEKPGVVERISPD